MSDTETTDKPVSKTKEFYSDPIPEPVCPDNCADVIAIQASEIAERDATIRDLEAKIQDLEKFEAFVVEMAAVKNLEGWQGDFFRRARELLPPPPSMTDIRDQRALAFPDEPYSAYCKVCWQNVYCLWIDKKDHHGGVCMFGHTKMQDCRQAMQWSEAIGKIKSYVKKSEQKVTPDGK